MIRKLLVAALASTALSAPAFAQEAADDAPPAKSTIIVTAARTILPPSALPLTIDIIDKEALDQQIAMSGSVTDAVADADPQLFADAAETVGRGRDAARTLAALCDQRHPAIDPAARRQPRRLHHRRLFRRPRRADLSARTPCRASAAPAASSTRSPSARRARKASAAARWCRAPPTMIFPRPGWAASSRGWSSTRPGAFDAIGRRDLRSARHLFAMREGRPVGINLTQGETQDIEDALAVRALRLRTVTDSARLDLIASRFELKGDGDYVAVAGNRATGLPTSAVRGTPPGNPAHEPHRKRRAVADRSPIWAAAILSARSSSTAAATPLAARLRPDRDLSGRRDRARSAPCSTSRRTAAASSAARSATNAKCPGSRTLTADRSASTRCATRTEQRLIATDRVWVPPTDFRSLAPFAQANLKLFDGLVRLAGGARYENVKITIDDYTTLATTTTPRGGVLVAGGSPTFDDVLLNGGVIVEPITGIRAYASYAEGFTVPDVGRITRAISTAGVDIDNFLDISPIISNNREIGVEVKRGPLDASATYFWSSSTKGQLLIARPDGIFDVQRQRVEIEGLEINLAVQMPIDGLTLSAGYAHLIGRFDSDSNADGMVDTDLDGTNISPDRLNLAASYDRGPLSARVQTQVYLSRSFDKAPGRDPAQRTFRRLHADRRDRPLPDRDRRHQPVRCRISSTSSISTIPATPSCRPTTFFNFAGRGRTLHARLGLSASDDETARHAAPLDRGADRPRAGAARPVGHDPASTRTSGSACRMRATRRSPTSPPSPRRPKS